MLAMSNLQQAGLNSGLQVLLYALLSILVLGVVFWLLNHRRAEPAKAERQEQPAIKEDAAPDDLTRIEGIGPKVANVLKDAGITTFAALADADPANLQETLKGAGLQMMKPDGWIEQAKLAAKGDWKALERLQEELKGGRRT